MRTERIQRWALRRRTVRGVYLLRFSHGGRVIERSTGLRDEASARERAEEMLATADLIRDPPRGTESVYFLCAPLAGMLKIGRAADVGIRVANLRTACPVEVVLLATASGGARAEAALHAHFDELRVRGEWFRYTGALVELVQAIARGESAELDRIVRGRP